MTFEISFLGHICLGIFG